MRSVHVFGAGMLRFLPSISLYVIAPIHPELPNHCGGVDASLNFGAMAAKPFGVYGSSNPFFLRRSTLVTARPQTASARVFSFSAISRAAMTPVESRTQLMVMPGLSVSNAFLYALRSSFSYAV